MKKAEQPIPTAAIESLKSEIEKSPSQDFRPIVSRYEGLKLTAQESRVEEINQALAPAYKNASKLKISKSEAKQLMKPFPDSSVEIRPHDGLIYLAHTFLSERLNQVFMPGNWSLICRRHWADENISTVYGEHILIIRGCFAGEAIGEFLYHPLSQRFGDALEATKAEALRRCCKQLSCGTQVYKPDYIAKWKKKFAVIEGIGQDQVWTKKGAVRTLDSEIIMPGMPSARQKPAKEQATEDSRHIMLQILCAECGNDNVLKYAIANAVIKAGQKLEDWPLEKVAITEGEVKAMTERVKKFLQTDKPEVSWQQVEVPFGSRKGKKLGDLDKKTIWEYCKDFVPVKDNQTHLAFRKALDEAGQFNKFKLKK